MGDLNLEEYEAIDITKLPKNTYFHYTNINNFESIFHDGFFV